MNQFREKVISAFPVTPTPKRIVTDSLDYDGIDCRDLKRDFPKGRYWTDIPGDRLDFNCYSLAFFSDEAFRYYAPAFMIRGIINNDVFQFTCYSLSLPEGDMDIFTSRANLFSREQVCVVLDFLLLAKEKKYDVTASLLFWGQLSQR